MHHSSELYIHIYILFIRIKKPMHLLINKCTVGWITPGYELSCYHLDLDFIITPFKKKKIPVSPWDFRLQGVNY